MPDVLRAIDFDRPTVDRLIAAADGFCDRARTTRMGRMVVALAFFEPSLRTRVGFEVAAARLGAATTTVITQRLTNQMSAPESFADTIRVVGDYCDVVCLRHSDADAPFIAAALIEAPVINCGNGTDEHPTQALIDLFAIQRLTGRIDGTRIALVGDLRHMPSAHSLLVLLGLYDVAIRCISPADRVMPRDLTIPLMQVAGRSSVFEETQEMALDDIDVVYVAGFPARTSAGEVGLDLRERFAINRSRAQQLPTHARILCPLPRIDEISGDVDPLPSAAYFQQSALGLPMRMAVLEHACCECAQPG